jgi:hypothetical protein
MTPQKRARVQFSLVSTAVSFFISSAVRELLIRSGGSIMSLVRLLGFTTLPCGCVTGRYREVATNREVTYVEEKGGTCSQHAHRRNHTIAQPGSAAGPLTAKAS